MGQKPKKPEDREIDWEAFGEWAEAHDGLLRQFKKIPRKQLELVNAIASFHADRATEQFLKAVDGMRSMRELAQLAVSLLPDAERKGKELGKLIAALEAPTPLEIIAAEFQKRRSKAGKATAKLNQAAAAERAKIINCAATELLNKGLEARRIPGKLTSKTFPGAQEPYSRNTINKVLRTHPSGKFPPREKKKKM